MNTFIIIKKKNHGCHVFTENDVMPIFSVYGGLELPTPSTAKLNHTSVVTLFMYLNSGAKKKTKNQNKTELILTSLGKGKNNVDSFLSSLFVVNKIVYYSRTAAELSCI